MSFEIEKVWSGSILKVYTSYSDDKIELYVKDSSPCVSFVERLENIIPKYQTQIKDDLLYWRVSREDADYIFKQIKIIDEEM